MIVSILSLVLLTACGKNLESDSSDNPSTESQSEFIENNLNFCSKLSFSGMRVPEGISISELNVFALALNITSTFEGRQQWKNITNSFDGMGLSLGLLNQTLGTGSLQPLLVEMLEAHPQQMASVFTPSHFTSIKNMTLAWKQASGLSSFRAPAQEDFASNSAILSDLDNNAEVIFETFDDAEDASVTWALNTIYTTNTGRTFKTDWKKQLQDLCVTKEYRDIQFEASRYLHQRAKGYMERFELTQLRSYLFLFDIMVQNGGFYQQNLTDFRNFMSSNPNATENQKLQALLTSRLVQVRDEFKEDVRARKQSLINGSGVVHGTQRNYEREFCYSSGDFVSL